MSRTWELVISTKPEYFLEFVDKEIPYRLPNQFYKIDLFEWENNKLVLDFLHLRKPKEYEPFSGDYDYMLSGSLGLIIPSKGINIIDNSFSIAPFEILKLSVDSLHIFFYKYFSYIPQIIPDTYMKKYFIESDKKIFPLLQYIYERIKDLFEVNNEIITGDNIKVPKDPKRLRIWKDIYKILLQMESEYKEKFLDGHTQKQHISWEERIQYLSNSMSDGVQIPTERTLRDIMNAGRNGYL